MNSSKWLWQIWWIHFWFDVSISIFIEIDFLYSLFERQVSSFFKIDFPCSPSMFNKTVRKSWDLNKIIHYIRTVPKMPVTHGHSVHFLDIIVHYLRIPSRSGVLLLVGQILLILNMSIILLAKICIFNYLIIWLSVLLVKIYLHSRVRLKLVQSWF